LGAEGRGFGSLRPDQFSLYKFAHYYLLEKLGKLIFMNPTLCKGREECDSRNWRRTNGGQPFADAFASATRFKEHVVGYNSTRLNEMNAAIHFNIENAPPYPIKKRLRTQTRLRSRNLFCTMKTIFERSFLHFSARF
jgi:hypothetical protein